MYEARDARGRIPESLSGYAGSVKPRRSPTGSAPAPFHLSRL